MLMLIIMIVIIMTTLVPTKYYYYNNELLYQFLTKHEQLLPKKTLRPGNVPWPKHGAKNWDILGTVIPPLGIWR